LTVGGTGKSVFVAWLAKESKFFDKPAVLLHGYKSPILVSQNVFIVSDGSSIFGDASVVGDEPLHIAEQGNIATAIGKDRSQALQALLKALPVTGRPDAVILDDGYQTATIQKDCSILLVDARYPFGNGYLLPAGPLREHDYSRADIIIFTHADEVDFSLIDLKKRYFPSVNPIRIVGGRHVFAGIDIVAGKAFMENFQESIVLCSGIANPYNLEKTAREAGFNIVHHIIFPDHHNYEIHDVQGILDHMIALKNVALVTTAKDWTKLRSFAKAFSDAGIVCQIVKIRFEFLTSDEYATFVALLQNVLVEGRAAQ